MNLFFTGINRRRLQSESQQDDSLSEALSRIPDLVQ